MANEATPIEQAMADALDPTGKKHPLTAALFFGWERCTHEGIGKPGCITCDPDRARCAARAEYVEQAKAQAFFEQLAASIVTPHVGEQHRDTIKSVLHRATEAGLYTP